MSIKHFLTLLLPFRFLYALRKKYSPSYWMWGKAKKQIGHYIIHEKNAAYNFEQQAEHLDKELLAGFVACAEVYKSKEIFLRKYILEVSDCLIEPRLGWGILKEDKSLVFDSISYNAWSENYHPDYFDFLRKKTGAIRVEQAISINIIKGGEDNYWHFIHDLLGQMALAKKYLPDGIPFLISKNLSEKSYFKFAFSRSPYLSSRTWLIRDQDYYQCQKVYFIQPLPNNFEQIEGVLDLLHIKQAEKNAEKKVFLTRNKTRIRHLSNAQGIEEIALSLGFEVVDADKLNLEEQAVLFGQTRYLISIHGAGLTNIIYRNGAPLDLLEIFPANYIQPHYYELAKGFGHRYSHLIGSKIKADSSFYLDPLLFEKKIKSTFPSFHASNPAQRI